MGLDSRSNALFVVHAASLGNRLLGQKANVFKPPFLAQPRSPDDLEDFFESRIRIRDLRRYGRVLHGPLPLVEAGSSPPVIFFGRASSWWRKLLPMQDYCKALRRKTTAPLDRGVSTIQDGWEFRCQEEEVSWRDLELPSYALKLVPAWLSPPLAARARNCASILTHKGSALGPEESHLHLSEEQPILFSSNALGAQTLQRGFVKKDD